MTSGPTPLLPEAPGDRRFATLDAVRAAGATMVVLTHCAFNTGRITHGWTGAVLARLDVGVALFFVVSGFLLSRPWFVASSRGTAYPSVAHYLWKRALRILPLYWLVVVVALLADPANRGAGAATWVTHLTLTQLYRPDALASSLTQMWSLCTEVAFYLLLPLLVRWLTPRGRLDVRRVVRRCAALSVVGLSWAALAGSVIGHGLHAAQWLPGYLPWFLLGSALAAVSADPAASARMDVVARDLAGWWVVGVAVFAIACTPIAGPRLLTPPTAWQGLVKCLLYAVIAGCLILPLLFGPEREGRVRRWLASRVPTALGEISYSVFCIHMFVLVCGMRLAGIDVFTGHFWLVLIMTVGVSVPLAAASYAWLERPAMRWRNRGPFAPARLPALVPTRLPDDLPTPLPAPPPTTAAATSASARTPNT